MQKPLFEQLPELVVALTEKIEQLEKAVLSISQSTTGTEMEDTLLTVDEAAEYLHLTKNTLYSLVSRSRIPVCKRSKRLYFNKKELKHWVSEGRRKTDTELLSVAETYIAVKPAPVKKISLQ